MSFIKAVFNLILPEIELIKLSIFLFFMLRVIHRIVSISSKILQKKVSFPQKVLKSAVKSVILASFLYFWEKVVEKSTSDCRLTFLHCQSPDLHSLHTGSWSSSVHTCPYNCVQNDHPAPCLYKASAHHLLPTAWLHD